ncbi:DUF411 domain-containing protein [Polycladidibacter hongkongensis]|uniref:DUF411 domain-containing protein n=1 Tax=Polycladidibacter hongkongensis TaxID=1647556 RepID=UPI0009E66269|nr:DUF411 domain-containing protein [Pseudovibrio hongkongensis]
MKRVVLATLIATLSGVAALTQAQADQASHLTIYKTPWCGCCSAWAEKLKEAGFSVAINTMEDLDLIKQQLGITDELASCHSALLDGYVLEGHVPLEAIDKLLDERPKLTGLATPGMPAGSLGMGEPDADTSYVVYGFKSGSTQYIPFYKVGN